MTPAVLTALAEATGGAAVQANVELAESNAAVAAEIAVALTLDSNSFQETEP